MPYANSAEMHINYPVSGDGPPLVLQHGFMCSAADWVEFGYAAALSPRFRIILIDALGHGDSDKPHDEAAYAMERRVADVVAVLDAVGVERAHF